VRKKSTESVAASSPTWETLEAFARHSNGARAVNRRTESVAA